jgi:hypothetical protein
LITYVQAFVSYLRSIYLHKDKAIFKIDELPVDRYAESLGLPGAPKIKFLGKEIAKKKKNASRTVGVLQAEIAREHAAKLGDKSDNQEEEESSSEEETALPVGNVYEPIAKASTKVCRPPLTHWLPTKYLVPACCSYQVRPDVRAQKSKVGAL